MNQPFIKEIFRKNVILSLEEIHQKYRLLEIKISNIIKDPNQIDHY